MRRRRLITGGAFGAIAAFAQIRATGATEAAGAEGAAAGAAGAADLGGAGRAELSRRAVADVQERETCVAPFLLCFDGARQDAFKGAVEAFRFVGLDRAASAVGADAGGV